MMRWNSIARTLATLVVGFVASLSVPGCSADSQAQDDPADDGTGGESSEDALQGLAEPAPIQTVESYAAIPLEDRVVTRATPKADVGDRIAVVRSMTVAGVSSVLGFNARTNETIVVSRAELASSTRIATAADGVNAYVKRLDAVRTADATLKRFRAPKADRLEVALTIDMCQSSKPWDKALFDFLVERGAARHVPTPIGIAMTGGWAKAHPAELQQLRQWDKNGSLAITWINHSYTHPLHCTNNGRTCTFLTDASIAPQAFEHEVLDNEQLLLRQGFAVSPLFRFPGLVHDAERRRALSGLSLFALDADAWLAKGETMHDGAVVLVHGNGNEPRGISMFLDAMHSERSSTVSFVSPLRAVAVE